MASLGPAQMEVYENEHCFVQLFTVQITYHNEPLKGDRKGQRSVRLNKAYRVIYEETESGNVVLIGVQEVNKHEY